jgi:hypothetical protein
MDKGTLTFLLRGGHLSMSERIERGLWPHDPLKFSAVVKHLADVIQYERWFPCEWQTATQGEPIREGGIIERKARFLYVYRVQRHCPDNPYVLAGQSQKVFYSARRAARHYLKHDLYLPGDLDGWKVVD